MGDELELDDQTDGGGEVVEEEPMTDEPMNEQEQEQEQTEEEVEEAPESQPNGGSPLFPVIPAPPALAERAGAVTGGALVRIDQALESPTMEANGDDLSDLFEGPQEGDLDIEFDDLIEVDDDDIFGEGGDDLSDVVGVTNDDIMGPDVRRRPSRTARRRTVRGSPAGMQGIG